MNTRALCVALAFLVVACDDSQTPTAVLPPSFAIQDGAHGGGNPHFYWIPPIVTEPSPPAGTFDATSSPVVRINEWPGGQGVLIAEYTMSSGPGSETVHLDAQGQQYYLNWDTGLFRLNPNLTYRIRVFVSGVELGFADVDVVTNANDLRKVDRANYVPLRNGRSLLIPFRIEQGALGTSLRLVKHVVNDNRGTSLATDFTLTASGPTPISGAGDVSSGAGFLPGTYTLSETGPAGYTAGAWTCTGGSLAGNQITLAPADTAVCNITNDDVAPEPNYVRLQSETGDYIGQGRTYAYSQTNAVLSVTASGGHLSVGISGDEGWGGDFQVPNTLSQLEPGTYTGLRRYPFHDPAVGGLSWSGEGRGCNTLTGSFTITSVTYVNNALSAIDLSFEQHCEGGAPALRGQIHWDSSDQTRPPGPVFPVPDGLWQPAPGSTPPTGNFAYLDSDVGDYIGGGQTYLYTSATATITAAVNGGHATVGISGDQGWGGDFQTMNTINQLQPGYYPDLRRYPFHNPAKGGLSWFGEGRGCNTLSGWFVVDRVVYTNGVLTALDLRFEQHCGGGTAALHGQIHWDSSDPTRPPGPVFPVPAGLWQPAPGSTPPTGNYTYLDSDVGDFIGQGQIYLYTPANATITLSASGGHATVAISGAQGWNGDFQTMNTINQLQPGYYPDLHRYPFHNPSKGGLSWTGEGRGCNTLLGWFVVDRVVYSGGVLTALDLRFEQRCEGGTPALHGAIHWDR